MNLHRTLLTRGIAIALLIPTVARSQEVRPEDRNAALRYATIAYSTDRDLVAKVGDVDWSNVGFDAAAAPADFKAAVDAIKADGSGIIEQLIETSRLKRCDFEIPWEDGIGVLLPHLGKLRTDARLLRLDARRLEMAGDAAGAAERLAAMIRMSRHASGDHILISSLVGVAICNLAMDETEAAMGAGRLTPGAQATIAQALASLDADDPFALKAAIRGEQRWTLGWIRATFHGPDAGKQFKATGFLDFQVGGVADSAPAPAAPAGQPPPPPPSAKPDYRGAAAQIAGMNQEQLVAAVERANPFYDKVIAAWNKPGAVEQLRTLCEQAGRGEFGPVAVLLVPAADRARESTQRVEHRISDLKQKLSASR